MEWHLLSTGLWAAGCPSFLRQGGRFHQGLAYLSVFNEEPCVQTCWAPGLGPCTFWREQSLGSGPVRKPGNARRLRLIWSGLEDCFSLSTGDGKWKWELVSSVTKKALRVGRRGHLEIRDLKSHFAFTHTEPQGATRWRGGVWSNGCFLPETQPLREGL